MRTAWIRADHLQNTLVAVGTDCDALDTTETAQYWTSTGALEPIIPTHVGPKYIFEEIEIPQWLVAGFARGQQDGRYMRYSAGPRFREMPVYWAVLAVTRQLYFSSSDKMAAALTHLVTATGRNAQAMRQQFVANGILTDTEAISCLPRPTRRRRY